VLGQGQYLASGFLCQSSDFTTNLWAVFSTAWCLLYKCWSSQKHY